MESGGRKSSGVRGNAFDIIVDVNAGCVVVDRTNGSKVGRGGEGREAESKWSQGRRRCRLQRRKRGRN